MRDCKIIHLGYDSTIQKTQRMVTDQFGVAVFDHPNTEKLINLYLAKGYRIVNAYKNDGTWFILERDSNDVSASNSNKLQRDTSN